MKKYLTITVLLIGILVGYFARPLLSHTDSPNFSQHRQSEIRENKPEIAGLTNPLLECGELEESFSIGERLGLEEELQHIVNEYKKKGEVVEAGIYFRDLNNGPWFGINEEYAFTPASLLKVPLAMTFYERAHREPGLLDQEIEFGGKDYDPDAAQSFGPAIALEEGKVYTVRELIRRMLTESSNEATLLLTQIAGEQQIQKIYKDFGQPIPETREDQHMNVHTYASFFRILYNATYINRPASEEILAMLTRSTFEKGIRAGVPASIQIAHKFGERETPQGTKRLHDCGIVYAPDRPYILCIMSEGRDYAALSNFIADISKRVYEEVRE